MKILQVNNVYRNGSTGKIVFDLNEYIKGQGNDAIVCYGRGTLVSEKDVYKITSEFAARINVIINRVFGFQYGGCYASTLKLIRIIKREKPDIVHLHCINGSMVNVYVLVNWLKSKGIKTVITLHAEFFHTGSCGHAYECEKWLSGCGKCPRLWESAKSYFFDTTHAAWVKMKKAFSGFGDNLAVVSVSPWLMERASRSPILEGYKHYVIKNGTDTGIFRAVENTDDLRKKYGLGNEKIILHVTASFTLDSASLKGGKYIVELAENLKGMNVKIFIVGSRKTEIELPDNIVNVGRIENQKLLAAYYSLADLCVIVSKRETYSMVCAEALCCGTPVAGFKAGGPESISLTDYSEFVDYGDMEKLANAVSRWLGYKTSETARAISERAVEEYSEKKMCLEYLRVYNSFYSNTEGK